MAGFDRTPDGLRLRLAATEVDVVASLAEGLAQRAREGVGTSTADAVLDRLAPPVSRGDRSADAEVRPMLRDDLLGMRAERLADLATMLRGGVAEDAAADGGFDRVLDRPAAMRVVESLNDLRLALAATIGFDGTLRDELVEDDHRADAVRLMDALAWLQGGLIEYVEGDLPG